MDWRFRFIKIVYIRNLFGFSGDVIQGNLLTDHLDAIPLSASPIPGKKPGLVKVDDFNYPVNSIMGALDKLEPDIVFVHTITPNVVNELPQIVQKYVTVWRLAVNFEELYLVPTTQNLLGNFWNIMRMFDCVIAPSEHVKGILNGLGFENVVYIPTMVDSKMFKITSGQENNVLTVGRIGPIKNIVLLILAFQMVRKEVPDVRMVVVGDGPLRRALQQMTNNLGLGSVVQFVGLKPANQFYSGAKIYVQSSFSENGSLTVIESLASGLPCVVSDIGGHDYKSKAVIKVNSDDVCGFARKMVWLLKSDKDWRKLHLCALKDIEQYDVKTVIPKYMELFEDLMKVKRFKR